VKKREVKEKEKQENERKREVDERRKLEEEREEQEKEQNDQKDEVDEEEAEEDEDEDEEEEDTDDSYFDTTDEDDGFNSDGVHRDEIAGKNSCNITTLTHLRMGQILTSLLLQRLDGESIKNGWITDIGLVSRHCFIGLFGLMIMALVMLMTIVCVLAFAGSCSLLRFGFNSALHLYLCIGSCCGLRTYFCINRIHFFYQMFLR
jgi:hypothetical protein